MSDRDVVARRVVVRGDVQGVFFRAATRDQAEACDVAGWVRNNPDGTVEAHLEGRRQDVDEVLDWMRRGGPPRARVEAVEEADVRTTGDDGFSVRR